jgi:hypothetical protein
MSKLEINDVWGLLIDGGYFTDDELQLITNINGYTIETLNDCIYARYGFRSYEQMTDGDDDNE